MGEGKRVSEGVGLSDLGLADLLTWPEPQPMSATSSVSFGSGKKEITASYTSCGYTGLGERTSEEQDDGWC